MTEQEETFAALQPLLKGIAEREEREFNERRSTPRAAFFGAIPEDAKSLYIHLSHQIPEGHPFVKEIQKNYGSDNVLITSAPSTSGQSFTRFNERIESEKKERLAKPFADFSAQKSIDAVIYLGNYICDGYQSPIFPQDVENKYHLWHAIRLAEQQQKPLIVGYRNGYCFNVKCYEGEYITNPEKIKCPTKIVRI